MHDDNLKLNAKRSEELVRRAAEHGAHLAVLPEYHLSGIISDDQHLASEEAEHLDDIKGMALKYRIDIVAGSIVERDRDSDNLFNTAYYVSSEGECLHTYKKRNLWHPEKEYLTASEEPREAFDTSRFRAGICICWDLAWPEAFRALMSQGAEVIIVPTYWTIDDLGPIGIKHDPEGHNEKLFLDSMIITRAYENACCIIFVNAGGPASKGFIGRSAVAMPLLGVIDRIDDPEDELRIVEVDLDVLADAEETYKVRADYAEKLERKRQRGNAAKV